MRRKAMKIASILSGASRLVLDARHCIKVGGVFFQHEDGKQDATLFAEVGVIEVRAFSPTVTITRRDGTIEESHPADLVKDWAGIALRCDAVAKIFEILSGGVLDWVNLYRIFEIVADDLGGLESIDASGWVTKASMKLFKHTANSPSALGLEARHGASRTQPPIHPMSISEARALVNSIVHAWLRSKVSSITVHGR